jgi:hypothetical protein
MRRFDSGTADGWYLSREGISRAYFEACTSGK